MTQIVRRNPNAVELVEVPEDHVVCPTCKGKGYTSKYEQGWSSLSHAPDLAAPIECLVCGGDGYVTQSLAEFYS